mgnify:CR=1 FL=1
MRYRKEIIMEEEEKKAHSSCSRNHYRFCFEYSVRSDESVRNRVFRQGRTA